MNTTTNMRREIDEIPEAVNRLIDGSHDVLKNAGAALRDLDPPFLLTIARGSSDHAALFLKYAVELSARTPVASLGPSLSSIYNVIPKAEGAAAIAISQSGKSPDIVAMTEAAGKGGATTIALANTCPSPLALACDHAIDICAGPEHSVAATKSFVNSIVAGLAVLAEWTADTKLEKALRDLPEKLAHAVALDWDGLAEGLAGADSIFVLGRGPALAIAHEAALKFKETCGLHAEAYSSAEVLHGPVEIVEGHFPVIALAARDGAEDVVAGVANNLAGRGTPTHVTSDKATNAARLPFTATGHPLTDALALVVPLYGFVEAWSRAQGRNPDAPANLLKVTETV